MSGKVDLVPVWKATLEIYMAVAEVCDRHGLRYYLTDGSAIGAVRHGGFIPWDDDFDMSMPREDYEKFIGYAKEELPENLKFVNWQNTPEFGYLFGKIQETDQKKLKRVEAECGYMLASGVYIDIIPIDGYPEARIERLYVYWYTEVLRQIWRYKWRKYTNQTFRGRIAWWIGCFFSLIMPWIRRPEQIMRRCERFLTRHPFEGAKYTGRASLYLTMLNREPLSAKVWGGASWHTFMGVKVPLPERYDEYLKFYYGDYMKLPPEEKRHPLHDYNERCAWWLGPTN